MKLIYLSFLLLCLINLCNCTIEDASHLTVIQDSNGIYEIVSKSKSRAFDPRIGSHFDPLSEVNFLLYTRKNPETYQKLIYNDDKSVLNSNFNSKHPTRFFAHGYNSKGTASHFIPLINGYIERGDYNIIMIDWERGANVRYLEALLNVVKTGKMTADFITFLNKVTGADPLNMAVIGHSLGAHVAGFTGKNLKGGLRLGAIYGLDAASPGFNKYKPNERLYHTDAEYVETIHTNGDVMGILYPVGHASFYPNYGKTQPNCDRHPNCDHNRALLLFIETITSNFLGKKCQNFSNIENKSCDAESELQKMGEKSQHEHVHGIYYVPTNGESPFSVL